MIVSDNANKLARFVHFRNTKTPEHIHAVKVTSIDLIMTRTESASSSILTSNRRQIVDPKFYRQLKRILQYILQDIEAIRSLFIVD